MKEQQTADQLTALANDLRWEIGEGYHDQLAESIYADASLIARNSVTKEGDKKNFRLDRTIDNIVTSRLCGFTI